MAQQGNGSSGHEQSIGTPTDLPVDGIAGSHPGTQEPSGAHVDAGKTRHGVLRREEGNQQHANPSGKVQGKARRTGSFANPRQGVAEPDMDSVTGSQGAGSAMDGGSGDSMQGGVGQRGRQGTGN